MISEKMLIDLGFEQFDTKCYIHWKHDDQESDIPRILKVLLLKDGGVCVVHAPIISDQKSFLSIFTSIFSYQNITSSILEKLGFEYEGGGYFYLDIERGISINYNIDTRELEVFRDMAGVDYGVDYGIVVSVSYLDKLIKSLKEEFEVMR